MRHLIRWRAGLAGLLLAMTGTALAASSATLTVKVTVIAGLPCVINNNSTIEVKFYSVPTDEVDGVQHKERVNYSLDCSVATAANKTGLKLTISGTGAGFDNALKTNFSDLGIKLLQGTTPLTLGQSLPFTNGNPPELYAVPVKKNGADLTGGNFSAGATLTVEYQ